MQELSISLRQAELKNVEKLVGKQFKLYSPVGMN